MSNYRIFNKVFSTCANIITVFTLFAVLYTNYLVNESNRFGPKLNAIMILAQEQIKTLDELSNLIMEMEISVINSKLDNKDNSRELREYLIKIANKAQKLYTISSPGLKPFAKNIYSNSLNINDNSYNNIKKSFNELCDVFNKSYFNQKYHYGSN